MVIYNGLMFGIIDCNVLYVSVLDFCGCNIFVSYLHSSFLAALPIVNALW